MLVNSAFSACLNGWFLMRTGLQVVLIAIFLTTSSFSDETDRDLKSKQLNISIRQIGHRLLLQAGDLKSRVMPVNEIKPGTFQLRFENKFVFNHDSLMALSKSLLPKSLFPLGYTVTVNDCATGGIVYGFQLNNSSPDILACSGRREPAGCYTIEFAFPGLYENVNSGKTESDQRIQSVQDDRRKSMAIPEGLKSPGFAGDSKLLAEEVKSVPVDSAIADPTINESQATGTELSIITIVSVGMLLVLAVTLLISRFRKTYHHVYQNAERQVRLHSNTIVDDEARYDTLPGESITQNDPLQEDAEVHDFINGREVIEGQDILQDTALLQGSIDQLPALGQFLFDVKEQRLHLGTEVITLTDKECQVLELLHKHFGELIPRDTLLQEIWINEGVITGRSLDMFVSKLRKKLSGDTGLRITNVHGKGYKLEVPAA